MNENKKQYKFLPDEIESKLGELKNLGITEFSIYDKNLSKDKNRLLKIMQKASEESEGIFFSILTDVCVIDKEIVNSALKIFCSFDIPLEVLEKGGKCLFDKKKYASKANLLNQNGMVFGFYLDYSTVTGDSLRNFCERLDFAINQFPNHIDFPQTFNSDFYDSPKVTALFSAKDLRIARDVSFACRTFYSCGRAVPWFLSVLKPLKIHPSKFFSDFSEWQRCNNCDYKSGFVPENENHKNLEKMQLLFLEQKYEEKQCQNLFEVVYDIVRINGAMSRLCGEGEECVLETSYNPDDLFSEEILDIEKFSENVCMENSKVKIFESSEGPSYKIESNY